MFDNPEDNQYIKEQIETTGKLKKEAADWYLKEGENLHTPYLNPVEGDFTGRMPEFMYVIYAMEGLSTGRSTAWAMRRRWKIC